MHLLIQRLTLLWKDFRKESTNSLNNYLTLSWRKPILYRNQSIDLRSKSMDWFLYDIGLRHERVKQCFENHDLRPYSHLFSSNDASSYTYAKERLPKEKHSWWKSSIVIFRFGKKFLYWYFCVKKFPDQLSYRAFPDGCLWWRFSYI